MIPVTQTKFGGEEGNCFPSCLASILHADLDTIPNFCAHKSDSWFHDANRWLYTNYRLFMISYDVSNEDYLGNFQRNMPAQFQDAYTILTGPAPRGFRHCCVGKGLELAHDPHPSRDGLLRTENVEVFVSAGSGQYSNKPRYAPRPKHNPHTFPWRYQ